MRETKRPPKYESFVQRIVFYISQPTFSCLKSCRSCPITSIFFADITFLWVFSSASCPTSGLYAHNTGFPSKPPQYICYIPGIYYMAYLLKPFPQIVGQPEILLQYHKSAIPFLSIASIVSILFILLQAITGMLTTLL